MSIQQSTVLITGAGGGSGAATAKAFLARGYRVIAGDLRTPDWETDFEDQLQRVQLDVTDEAAIDRLVAQAEADGTPIQVLVNNAGIAIGVPIQDMTTEIWMKNLAVNTTGTFFCTRAVVRVLLKNHLVGSIINIASVAGKNGFADTAAYCASKAGIIGFTRGLAAELGPKDITVNAICPGSVDTPMIQRVIDDIAKDSGDPEDMIRERMVASIPMKRFQTPEDIAALAVFLGSDYARNINGESINLDGGAVRD